MAATAASIALPLPLSALAASCAIPCGPFWATAEPTLMSLQLPAKEKPIELCTASALLAAVAPAAAPAPPTPAPALLLACGLLFNKLLSCKRKQRERERESRGREKDRDSLVSLQVCVAGTVYDPVAAPVPHLSSGCSTLF